MVCLCFVCINVSMWGVNQKIFLMIMALIYYLSTKSRILSPLSRKTNNKKRIKLWKCIHEISFPLWQNRGASFSLNRNHVNCVAGGKRPYHTIIPALLTDSASKSQKTLLLAALGVMGAFMQPQGHIQVHSFFYLSYLSFDLSICKQVVIGYFIVKKIRLWRNSNWKHWVLYGLTFCVYHLRDYIG